MSTTATIAKAAAAFTPEMNKAVILKYFTEYWAKGNADIVDEVCLPNYVMHYPLHGTTTGRTNAKAFRTNFSEGFPDLTFWAVGPLIAENTPEGDFVAGRWEGGGTHTGPVPGPSMVYGNFKETATGKKMVFSGTTVFRLENGMIAEEMGEEGAISALSQLGIVGPLNF